MKNPKLPSSPADKLFLATEYSTGEMAVESMMIGMDYLGCLVSGDNDGVRKHLKELQCVVCLFQFAVEGKIKKSSADAFNEK